MIASWQDALGNGRLLLSGFLRRGNFLGMFRRGGLLGDGYLLYPLCLSGFFGRGNFLRVFRGGGFLGRGNCLACLSAAAFLATAILARFTAAISFAFGRGGLLGVLRHECPFHRFGLFLLLDGDQCLVFGLRSALTAT